ncbi:NADH-quinone oxidoreductase subunit C [Occallatibacter savannae]|uniref:NADH-quinone oxidoreductase subunit C n=1 Tax=Occallatibacter savannae TaxID=1002691 RepID=UPI000D69DC06|nr:NADH-quinone oxidoreductase subunit C [Occallatibacter savannae]
MAEATQETIAGKQAVLERMSDHAAVKALVAWNADAIIDALFDRGELSLTVPSENIVEAVQAIKEAGYNAFEDMTAVDWLPSDPRFQLTYHILSHAMKQRVRIKAWVSEADPAVESITSVFPGANFYEREVFDLFGIRFEGHPNLRRIMMPEEWVGHPLRKDYPVEGYR